MDDPFRSVSRAALLLVAAGAIGCAHHASSPLVISRAIPAPTLASGFTPALPGYTFQFPRDSGAHAGSKTEWWYYTGHLHNSTGNYGFELTFFRVGLTPHPQQRTSHWATSTLYLAHFAITDKGAGQFHAQELSDRGSLGYAGANMDREHVWLGDWEAEALPPPNFSLPDTKVSQVSTGPAEDPGLWQHSIRAASNFGSLNLILTPLKPPVIQGKNGVSRKGAGVKNASHYYSYTRMAARGTLSLPSGKQSVTGLVWMDHEFASDQLSSDERGWDWFSIQLADGWDLMLYQLRLSGSGGAANPISPYSSGSIVAPDGLSRFLSHDEFSVTPHGQWKSPHSGAVYPSEWEVKVPSAGLNLQLAPAVADQELQPGESAGVTYWEGAMQVSGQHNNKPVSGQGYTELTGYGAALEELR